MKILKKHIDWNDFLNFVIVVFILMGIELLIMNFISVRTTMTSSMDPSFKVGGVQLDRAYFGEKLKRGTAIGFDYPYEDKVKHLGKRIIGLPGEEIKINKKGVYINGKLLNEPYVSKDANYDNIDATFVVPKDCYFVMGDNRNDSLDSRFFQEPFVHKSWITRITYATINKEGFSLEKGSSKSKYANLQIPNL